MIQFLMALLIISCVIQPRHALDRPLNLPPLRVLGIISYGMYLFHMWVLHMVSTAMVKGGVESPWLRFAGCLLLTAAVAGVSYRYFEMPFLKLKRYFSRDRAPTKLSETLEPTTASGRPRATAPNAVQQTPTAPFRPE